MTSSYVIEYECRWRMVIYFRDEKLKKTFSSEKELISAFGAELGRLIMRRISELKAFRCLADLRTLPQLRVHEFANSRKGQFSITIRLPHRLIIQPTSESLPRLADGGQDWATATEVTVIEVVDYPDRAS